MKYNNLSEIRGRRRPYLFKLILIFCAAISSLSAQILPGSALKINSCYSGNKALFTANASLDDNVNVIAWTETNVPAQRWIAQDAGDNLFYLINAYSRKPLANSVNRPNTGNRIILTSTGTNNKWRLIPVDNTTYPNAYFICYSVQMTTGDDLYLEFSSNTDGSTLVLNTKRNDADSLRQMWTVTAEDILPNKVTPSFRDSVMRGWKDRYFNMLKTSTGFWGEAEMMETLLDAYETTGKQEYKTMFEEVYQHFVSYPAGWGQPGNGQDWRWNDYNDDIAWAVLASVRAYLMFEKHPNNVINYLTIAKNNYDWMYSRAMLPSGMLRWCQSPSGNQGSNSCINGPAEVAACYLAIATGDDSYYDKAKALYVLQRQYLYNPSTGEVYDSGSWNGATFTVGNSWVSTYNQGTFLGAAVMLYKRYGTALYRNDANKIVDCTRSKLCNSRGVINVCGSGNDLQGFKGILMRYLRRYIVDLAQPGKVAWMQLNALQAYNNRNSAGVIWTAWWEKTSENYVFSDGYNFANQPFGCSTAVSAAFNAPLDSGLIIKNAFETIEAENFDYVKGVFVERENDSTAVVGNTSDNYYTAYYNVDFGSNKATGTEFLVQNSRAEGKQIEIHLDNPSGALLGVADVPSSNSVDWLISTSTITPVTGRHNIYLVYKGAGFKIDHFRFTKDIIDGVKNPDYSTQLKLYPNPAADYLKVDSPHAGRLFVYNAQGNETDAVNIDWGITTLDIANYHSGIYFVTLNTREGNYFAKFIKK